MVGRVGSVWKRRHVDPKSRILVGPRACNPQGKDLDGSRSLKSSEVRSQWDQWIIQFRRRIWKGA